jgi:hypothetical protein
MAKMNINDMIKFRLTEYGELLRQTYWLKLGIQPPVLVPDHQGRIEMQMWEVMHTFGPFLHMGGEQIIVNNEIII